MGSQVKTARCQVCERVHEIRKGDVMKKHLYRPTKNAQIRECPGSGKRPQPGTIK